MVRGPTKNLNTFPQKLNHMEMKELIEKVEKRENIDNDYYLVHIFKMMDEANKNEWQIGYYNKANKKVTTYVYNEKEDTVSVNPESEVFRKEDSHINPLNLDDVKIGYDEALKRVKEIREEKYHKHPVQKSFFILQNTGNIVWNFTFVTKTFNVLNLKLNAENGEIEEENLSSIFDFKDKVY